VKQSAVTEKHTIYIEIAVLQLLSAIISAEAQQLRLYLIH
jgi:hypothetical protein